MLPRKIWALADLHLSFGANKPMEIFGAQWTNHAEKIADAWRERVGADDLMLVAGDISWAMKLAGAAPDLAFIRQLPGHKIFIRGNHDYWWDSVKKNRAAAGEKMYFIHNNAVVFDDVAIAGTRWWNFPFAKWSEFIGAADTAPAPGAAGAADVASSASSASAPPPFRGEDDDKIRESEWRRLRMSLDALPQDARLKICLTHFPPLGADAEPNPLTELLTSFGVHRCLYGHLHNLTAPAPATDCVVGGTRYLLTAADYLNFVPLSVVP